VSPEDRFAALLHEHRGIPWKVAASYASEAADRADLAQEIALQAWRSFARYDAAQRFSTWLYRVALNVAISHLRRESRRARHIVPADEQVLQMAAEPPAETDERIAQLHAFIRELGEMDRALVLLYLDGTPHEGIAEVLGVSRSNVGTRLGRIKERLRRDFARIA
jgi:RNA polymerase sigma-70 factor (ECF subfamily)